MLMAGAPGRFVAGFLLQRFAQPAADRRAVGADRAVAGNIRQAVVTKHELVNARVERALRTAIPVSVL